MQMLAHLLIPSWAHSRSHEWFVLILKTNCQMPFPHGIWKRLPRHHFNAIHILNRALAPVWACHVLTSRLRHTILNSEFGVFMSQVLDDRMTAQDVWKIKRHQLVPRTTRREQFS